MSIIQYSWNKTFLTSFFAHFCRSVSCSPFVSTDKTRFYLLYNFQPNFLLSSLLSPRKWLFSTTHDLFYSRPTLASLYLDRSKFDLSFGRKTILAINKYLRLTTHLGRCAYADSALGRCRSWCRWKVCSGLKVVEAAGPATTPTAVKSTPWPD